MKDLRIGNDINVKWSIYAEGAPFSLEGKEISLYLRTPYGKKEVTPVVEGNAVLWTFFGKDQKHTGKHSLELVINEDAEGMVTTDACDFVNLVDCSCKVGGADDAGVQTETISLTSNLKYVATDAYDDAAVWEYINKLEKSKADKTEIPTKVSQLENDADYATSKELEGKQDEIKDLDAIRSGAAKGATALQSIPAEYVTDDELDNALRPKINANQIATINGKSLVNGGNIVIQGGEGGGYDDTEIRAELDELSAEVSGLSDKVDKLGEGGIIEIFEAKYGETTFNEIQEAYNAGKYIVCSYNGNVFHINRITSIDIYFISVNGPTIYRLGVGTANNWYQHAYSPEMSTNKTTSLSDKSTDTQYPSAKAVFTEIGKKSEVSLEALANGNLKVTINGESKDFMPATPSGDPMHYAYVAAGATYNATDADIPMVGIYGDSYVHKARHWHLNELGDITNEEMRKIYGERYPIASMSVYQEWFSTMKNSRTNCSVALTNAGVKSFGYAYYSTEYRTIRLGISNEALINSLTSTFSYSSKLEKVLTILNINNINSAINNAFQTCNSLKEVRIKGAKVALSLPNSSKLSNASIMYMIENEAASAAITVTLHADAYDRAMADTEITTALAAHPNVSLAKA